MGFSVEFEQLENYYDEVVKATNDFDDFLKDFLIEMANRLIAETKKRTPVITGDLRRSWILGDIIGSGKNISVEIKNGMEYATEVEYGHRLVKNGMEIGWVDGRFMLTISIDRIRKQILLRYKIQFEQFLHQRGLI